MAKKVTTSQMPQTQFIENANVLGQLIKAKRTATGMKLADCAALCNVGINTLSRIENGNDNCTLATAFAVLHGLGIKLSSPSLSPTSLEKRDGSSVCDDEWV
ncbi:helix-turn-helix domain-containing protein [Echinimonas agarilytica]|uniref:Helix-turn-helix domain-containing protein n=1 Tax=Echinimonas agarilytica TaxID=1215918 RepID=A0AA41W9A7_9GAMM|nr:helix-turn-helix domain-containing protein [Echinimonas agarilytica]MCM2680972.1 helix-turn-helix domain-containing protein [Echinimonas agarilytica]